MNRSDSALAITEAYLTVLISFIYILSFILPIAFPDGIDSDDILNGFSIHKSPGGDLTDISGADGLYE